jgi:hypothetical protein
MGIYLAIGAVLGVIVATVACFNLGTGEDAQGLPVWWLGGAAFGCVAGAGFKRWVDS